jgi:two-component system sensor histidine kinase QseC
MNTIRRQLTRKLLLGAAVLVGAGSCAVYLWARAALQNQFDAALRAKAQAITSLTEQKNGRVEVDFSDEYMRGFEMRGGPDFFELWHADGNVVERSHSLRDGHLPQRHGTLAAPVFWNLALADGQPGRAIGMSFRPQGGAKSSPVEATLVVASVRRDLDRTLTTLQLVLGGCGVLLLAATALVVPRVLRRELAPLQQLANEAAQIDAASLSARFPTAGLPGELAPISARLNELLARLENAFERERQFSADVAHEFRTPIAELRSLAELAVKLPDARAPNTDRETLAIALQLESIITRLLALARSETGQLPVARERVTLAPLVESVVRPHRNKASSKQLTLTLNVPATVVIDTDPALLRSILSNLVDNAIEYSPRGSAIEIAASVEPDRFTLRVINAAENLAPADLPRLFERFWRKDAARADGAHTGLGLPLALALARQLDCDLTATFAAPTRLALTLTGKVPLNTASQHHQNS